MNRKTLFVLALTAASISTASAQDARSTLSGDLSSALSGDVTKMSVKICSLSSKGNWRSITPVPQSWTVSDCKDYAKSVEADSIQVGCIFVTGPKYTWSQLVPLDASSSVPAPNCGW
jgi:hypothetical protein